MSDVAYSSKPQRNKVEDIGGRASSDMAEKASDKATEMASRAGEHLDSAIQSAESMARNVAQQGRDAGERVQQVAGNMRTAVDKSVREQPMATLAVAAALGFVIGALWKS